MNMVPLRRSPVFRHAGVMSDQFLKWSRIAERSKVPRFTGAAFVRPDSHQPQASTRGGAMALLTGLTCRCDDRPRTSAMLRDDRHRDDDLRRWGRSETSNGSVTLAVKDTSDVATPVGNRLMPATLHHEHHPQEASLPEFSPSFGFSSAR